MKQSTRWPFRGVQLDLARQMERLDYIQSFIDFISSHGLNVLVLYLEGRIRTKTFPYPPPEESYTPDEMKQVVQYAARHDIDVVPVVSNFMHAYQFLRYPELAHLAELRGGRQGRFGKEIGTVCPSLPATYAFFDAYLSEIAEIFPSPYMHLGNDEIWDIGFCELCRARAEGPEGQAGIFAKHLIATHDIVTKKLGKRMILWDDMFEHYPEALRQIPRDIVLCTWNYGNVDNRPKVHFKNLERRDLFAEYARLGFDYVAGSRELAANNIHTLTRYAAKHEPLGAFVTSWEHSRDFLLAYYPNIAFAGKLWSDLNALDTPEELKRQVIAELFPDANDASAIALRAFMDIDRIRECIKADAFLNRYSSARIEEGRSLNHLMIQAIASYQEKLAIGLKADIIEDILAVLGADALQFQLRELIPQVFERAHAGKPLVEQARNLETAVSSIKALETQRHNQWQKHRKGILSAYDALNRHWTAFSDGIKDFADKVKSGSLAQTGLLTLELFLPDAFSAQSLCAYVRYQDAEEWTRVTEDGYGAYKPLCFNFDDEYDHSAYYTVNLRMDSERPVTECRIESWGYGGQGIRYVEVHNRAGTFVPESICQVCGRVERPDSVLTNNSFWCYLGEPDTQLVMLNPALANIRHGLTVKLRKENG